MSCNSFSDSFVFLCLDGPPIMNSWNYFPRTSERVCVQVQARQQPRAAFTEPLRNILSPGVVAAAINEALRDSSVTASRTWAGSTFKKATTTSFFAQKREL